MKIVILLMAYTTLGFSDIHYSQKVATKDIKLNIINIDKNDTLNLRNIPSNKGKILTSIPFDANSLISKGKHFKNWIYIDYANSNNKTYTGWVYSKYITPISKYKHIEYKDFIIKYPFYIKTSITKDKLNFKYTVPYNYSQYDGGRFGNVDEKYFNNLDLDLAIYDNFEEAINANWLLKGHDYSNINNSSIIKKYTNGFKRKYEKDMFVVYVFIVNYKNKVFVYEINYNGNIITSLDKKQKIYLFTEEDKIKIMEEIIHSINKSKNKID